jgi:Ferritin-like domain
LTSLGPQEILIAFGEKPPSGCSFDFSSVLVDVSTMVSVARLVENVGVGAYLGAAHLIQDPRILTAAASIVTIESRHQTMLNLFEGASAISQPFDIPLLPQEVLAIAGSFIKGCDLGISGTFSPAPMVPFLFPDAYCFCHPTSESFTLCY